MGLSSGLMNRLKWKNRIFVNGQPHHNDYFVSAGDEITALLDEETPCYPPEFAEVSVIYEDAHLLAVDKPAGMLIHPSRSRIDGTLANRVLGYYQKSGQKSAFHPVTRLDRDTFGIVLIAKNAHIHRLLSETAMQKTYHALVYGAPPQDTGVINAPIDRQPLPSLLRFVSDSGKASVTEYSVLEKHMQYSKLSLTPVTGRTHQLRVHCQYIGCPILGDPQYNSEFSREYSQQLGLQSQLLCAKTLMFTHPITKETLCLESKLDV